MVPQAPTAGTSQEAGSSWHQEPPLPHAGGLRGSPPPLLPSGDPHDPQFLLGEESGEGTLPSLLLDTELHHAAAGVWDEGPKAGLLGPPMQHVPHGVQLLPHSQLPQGPYQHLAQPYQDCSPSSSLPGAGSGSHFQGLDELQLPLMPPGPLHQQDPQALHSQLPPGMEAPQQQHSQRHSRQTHPPVRLRD